MQYNSPKEFYSSLEKASDALAKLLNRLSVDQKQDYTQTRMQDGSIRRRATTSPYEVLRGSLVAVTEREAYEVENFAFPVACRLQRPDGSIWVVLRTQFQNTSQRHQLSSQPNQPMRSEFDVEVEFKVVAKLNGSG